MSGDVSRGRITTRQAGSAGGFPRRHGSRWAAAAGSASTAPRPKPTGSVPGQAEEQVRRLVASGDADIWIGDHSERTLTLLVNADRAFVMFLLEDRDESVTAGDPAAEGDHRPEHFTLSNGEVDEFERQTTTTHAQALKCVRTFLRDRSLDPHVRWTQ